MPRRLSTAAKPLGIEIRAGVHTGECEVMGEDVGGMAVHIASRVCDAAGPSEVLVSRTVRDLGVGSGFDLLEGRGSHELKGVPGEWEFLAVSRPVSEARMCSIYSAIETPGPESHMRTSDRVALAMARRTPWLLRAAARAQRSSSRS